MSRKAFHLGIDLDIHAVSCPGVWLCPKGDAMLRISMLGASAHTKRVEPVFPLLFHESFHFRKTLTGVTSLADLQDEMTKRSVVFQLVQWQVHGCRCVLLATFRSSLSELLYPQSAAKKLLTGVDIDLLMETTACFPGIIAPKIEVSTKVVIEEMVKFPSHNHDLRITQKTLVSKRSGNVKELKSDGKNKSSERLKMRQKPVCHTRPNVRCYYCKQRVERARKTRVRSSSDVCLPINSSGEDTIYTPYCNKCGDVVEEKEVKHGKIIMKKGVLNAEKWDTDCPCAEPQHSKSACNCNLCRKYDSLFKNAPSSPHNLSISKLSEWNIAQSPKPCTKDQHCSCLETKVGENLRYPQSDTEQREPSKDEEYRKMLKADLDTHYKKLYERLCRRSNRGTS